MDRADIVHQNFLTRIENGDLPQTNVKRSLNELGINKSQLLELFRSQVSSRQLDRVSRKLQARGEGFYTIGSSGHEGNAAIAFSLQPTDPAFLHYRDAAFQIHRASQVAGQTPIWDMLLSFTASSEDPISGGRHKVLGSKSLNIPPQTSTIASHLPKAVGAAYSIGLGKRVDCEHKEWPDDSVVMCSFGDASLNHSTAQGALNTASWTAYQNLPLPLIFVCEDNGIGISTKTPDNWVTASVSTRPALNYMQCDGLNILDVLHHSQQAVEWARTRRKPVFLHMRTVRLYGHAGADAQQAYMSKAEIEAAEADDPLLHTARILIENNIASRQDILTIYQGLEQQTASIAEQAIHRPKLSNAQGVMASIIPPKRDCKLSNGPSSELRESTFGTSDLRIMETPQNMAKLINLTLTDLMLAHDEIVLAGEDVGPKGGVYGVTQRLSDRFGPARVINTLLDEQSILGLAIGMAHNGFLPMPEIQFLAYLHNAEDQLRGEAATLSFFSNGQYTNPMVLRIAGLGYQRGFGGHFHNDNSLAVLRDIPGVVIACPSNGRDASLMLRECVRLAREEQRVVVFIEPIALYMTRDLHKPKDNGWCFQYPNPLEIDPIAMGQIGQLSKGDDLVIVTYGNGAYLSVQAEEILRKHHNIGTKIVDICWLAPLPEQALLEAVSGYKHILIVDECRKTGSQGEAISALFLNAMAGVAQISLVAGEDSFIATGPAYGTTLPSRDGIVNAAIALVKAGQS